MIKLNELNLNLSGKVILENVNLEINRGDKVALFGASGAGKTSILHVMTGLYPSTHKSISINGNKLNAHTLKDWRALCSYTGQTNIFQEDSVEEILKTPFKFHSNRMIKYDRDTALNLLETLNLDPVIMNSNPTPLSGGEKQRIAIARALLLNKEVLFLDEITSALDDSNKKIVMNILSEIDSTIISISHDPQWLSFCNRHVELGSGKILNDRTTGDLK